MIKVTTPFRGTFKVKNPKKIEYYKKLSKENPSIIIKEVHNGN